MNTIRKIGIVLVAFIALFLFSCKSNKTTIQSKMATTGQESNTTFENSNTNDEELVGFIVVEEIPLFNGKPAEKEFRNYVNENLKFPQELIDNNMMGKVYVEFFFYLVGTVTGAKVLQGLHPLLEAEALRVINSSPKWTPGEQRGKPVKVRYVFPVVFK
jgi:outer membrane biosynthesis protein TonB